MMQSRPRRVMRDADCDDDEPLVNMFIHNAVPASSSSSDLSDNLSVDAFSASESESGDEQVMFFNPLFFKFQKENWLTASKEAAKQFEARKLARNTKRQKCNESAIRRRETQMINHQLPKIHRRKPISHASRSGRRDNRLARSEGEITTEDEFSDQEHSCGAKKSKLVCSYLETMWKDSVQDDDNICEIWRDITVESDDFNDSKVGASFEEFRSTTAADKDMHFVKYGAIIASNLSFSTSLITGYTMITISTKRKQKTRIIGCSVSIASRSRKATAIVAAATTQLEFENFTSASLHANDQRSNILHSAKMRRGLTKKNNNCKCVFRLHMDKFFFWCLTPRRNGSHHSKHPTNAHLLKQHVSTEAVSFLADSGVRLNPTQSAAFVTSKNGGKLVTRKAVRTALENADPLLGFTPAAKILSHLLTANVDFVVCFARRNSNGFVVEKISVVHKQGANYVLDASGMDHTAEFEAEPDPHVPASAHTLLPHDSFLSGSLKILKASIPWKGVFELYHVAWAFPDQQKLASLYPEICCFDTTCKTNNEGKPFGYLIGFDHENVTLKWASVMLASESLQAFWWLFAIAMVHLYSHSIRFRIVQFLTDGDSNMIRAIRGSILRGLYNPSCVVRRCWFHLLTLNFEEAYKFFRVDGNVARTAIFNVKMLGKEAETSSDFELGWSQIIQWINAQPTDKLFSLYHKNVLMDYLDSILSIRDDWAQYAMVHAKLSLQKNTTCPNEGSHWGLKRDGFINDQADIDVVVKSDIAKVTILSFERIKETGRQLLMQSANPSTVMEAMLFHHFTKHVANVISKMMRKLNSGYVIKRGEKVSVRLRRSIVGVRYQRVFKIRTSERQIFLHDDDTISCECPDFYLTGIPCWHLICYNMGNMEPDVRSVPNFQSQHRLVTVSLLVESVN